MLDAVLFDFGGTLDGDGQPWLTQYARAFETAGIDVLAEALADAFRYSEAELVRRDAAGKMLGLGLRAHVALQCDLLCEALGIDGRYGAHAAQQFVQRAEARLEQSRKLLSRLAARGVRLGVVSNFTRNLQTLLEEAGLSEHLTVVAVSSVVGAAKPDPVLYRFALDALNVSGAAAAMVGDSYPSDIVPAHALGLTTFWLDRFPLSPVADASAATHRLPALAHLEALL